MAVASSRTGERASDRKNTNCFSNVSDSLQIGKLTFNTQEFQLNKSVSTLQTQMCAQQGNTDGGSSNSNASQTSAANTHTHILYIYICMNANVYMYIAANGCE